LDAYEAIGVPELWTYDSGRLKIYVLGDGKYIESEMSPILPEIAVVQIVPTIVERFWTVGSYQALEELERAIAR
jgi:hypothetical protein